MSAPTSRYAKRGPVQDLRFGDLCPRCNAASGIDSCPCRTGNCPLDVGEIPASYYEPRKEETS